MSVGAEPFGMGAWVGAGLVVAATVVATVAGSPAPPSLSASAEPLLVAATPGPLGCLWDALWLALPVGERGARGEFAVLLAILAVAAAAGVLAYRLYRGTGRGAAAFAAVPVCAALLLGWAREDGVTPGALGFTLLATLGLAGVVGGRVSGPGWATRSTWPTWVRGVVATIAAGLLWQRVGAAWAAVVFVYMAWTGSVGRTGWRRVGVIGAVALTLVVLAYMTWPAGQDLRLVMDLGAVARSTGPALLDLALALAVLLVTPLRWRGGGLLLALVIAGLLVGDRGGRLMPAPMLLVLLAVTACGWIWLAGSVRRRWLAWLGVAAATVAILGIVAASLEITSEPIAARRPEASLLALHQRGLIAPGDVLLAHDPWLASAFAAAQRDEGVRPDVELHAVASVDPARLSERLAGWARAGRRVLSDSFNYAGRWQAAWALDSGPLFWFVGTAGAVDRDFTDLRDHSPGAALASLAPAERARWERLHVERARHRRALGHPDEALLALPFDDDTLAALAQRLQLAKLSRLPAISGSELGVGAWSPAPLPASALAEVGDLLRALGDGTAGTERLEEAAARGVAEAFGALARWQLRAGEEEAARATLEVLAAAPVLRPQLLAVCRWLLARTRAGQARALLEGLAPVQGHAAEELGVRLGALRGLAGP